MMKTARLGFPKEGRARPVKVELLDTDSVQMIVRNRNKNCLPIPKFSGQMRQNTEAIRGTCNSTPLWLPKKPQGRMLLSNTGITAKKYLRYKISTYPTLREAVKKGPPEHNPRKSTKPDHANHLKNQGLLSPGI
ncbi:hypothetical protein JTB14_013882 [Gonioctena quinquepunctata]|nr:hypothetical protein JTB14_013882 [Gonioctena quinquepunctata]